MTATSIRPTDAPGPATERLAAALRSAGIRDVRADPTTRVVYSSDASLYRLRPQVVVLPYDHDEVAATVAVCRELGVGVTGRGGGTSIAGNSVGSGVVIDTSRHFDRIVAIDPDRRTATVEPGVVEAALQSALKPYGLRYGPDPSSHSRATIGGMIGNNACGNRALAHGRTSDTVQALRIVTAAGEATGFGPAGALSGAAAERLAGRLRDVAAGGLATIRTEFARFGRQVSGYALEHLLPERGLDVAKLLVGSEGTLGLVTQAEVSLVRDPAATVLVVLGFADIAEAGDAAPAVRAHGPIACEGLDSRIVDVLRARRGDAAVPPLPPGDAWLFVELAGEDAGACATAAARLIADVEHVSAEVVTDRRTAAGLWRIREDGAGLSGRSPRDRPAHAGWEDAAVPPEKLGAYLRDFDALMTSYDVTGLPYGHFADGCLHIRLDLPLDRPGGVERYAEFVESAAKLVASYGGSLSGEHGDGRARGALLPAMYSPDALRLFAEVKHAFDPDGLLNPGVLVDPAPPTADLRVPGAPALTRSLAFGYHSDSGDLSQAVHRCTGVGRCRADNSAAGGAMCPSYLASGEEQDSTRGRARALQELMQGGVHADDWRDPAVHEALELCLSCKACASDCPTGVDMATYKSEVLHQTYRRRAGERGPRRPVSHHTLGQLPRWLRLAHAVPGAGAVAPVATRVAARLPKLLAAAGIDARRSLPSPASETFRHWFGRQRRPATGDPVVLFVDSFTDHLSPEVGKAAFRVLTEAGYAVRLSPKNACCALTWITTGQLDAARRILGRTVSGLLTATDAADLPVVGLEPSCTATLRSDAVELAPTQRDAGAARRLAGRVRTLAEFLGDVGWTPPDLTGTQVVAQPHCHQHAVLGWQPDAELLQRAGAEVTRVSGCCGLAGNFGVEDRPGHYETSVKVAERNLLPAVAGAPDAAVLADGFSCRTQLADLTDRRGIHLAELLADNLAHAPEDGAAH